MNPKLTPQGRNTVIAQLRAFRDGTTDIARHHAFNEGLTLNIDFILKVEKGSTNQPATSYDAAADVAHFMKGRLP